MLDMNPALDLIQPRRVGRREVQIHIGMLLKEVPHKFHFLGGKVVQDDVHLAIDWLRMDDLFQERDKLLTGMSWSSLAEGIQCRIRCATLAGRFRFLKHASNSPEQIVRTCEGMAAENGSLSRQ
jgi:hypothetical protein